MVKRLAIIEKDKCNPETCGDYLCARICPINRQDKECITKAEDKKAQISEELCVGCGICQQKCPFNAIHIVNLPDKLTHEPIHRYGKNMFELFALPVIKKHTVIGIIGRNGIGKSTALNILAGIIQPNLGFHKNPATQQDILNLFSTRSIGSYFKHLFNNQIKISYKPQRIELLAKLYNGKVKDLLNKIDEKNKSKTLLKVLDLEQIEDRDIKELSGGELQRLTIIAAACRKADVYYFDEPASFCDITHRIKTANLIRELAEDAAVIVVEHDLATLDYISDEIQIVYGEAGCYGIFSNTKSVRRGINEYLDGYLTDDNVRFRNYQIKFPETQQERFVQQEILYEFPDIKKSFKTFKLQIRGGKIRKGEVLTIMGANGLGKTTFLKIISKQLKPDEGDIKDIKIAYKPQYLDNEINKTVKQFLKEKAGPEFSSGWYKTNILNKLNIKNILNNKIATLSGGELQKVHIAASLSGNAELILLDEPSAFVDIEDRLHVAEVIKEFIIKKEIAAIVVDHDIQFIDYLSDSMLVFKGKSGIEGNVIGPLTKVEGMNLILKMLNITYRKDKITNRPRINKPDSQLDKEQKSTNRYYYSI